jgi:hypothetical protein
MNGVVSSQRNGGLKIYTLALGFLKMKSAAEMFATVGEIHDAKIP